MQQQLKIPPLPPQSKMATIDSVYSVTNPNIKQPNLDLKSSFETRQASRDNKERKQYGALLAPSSLGTLSNDDLTKHNSEQKTSALENFTKFRKTTMGSRGSTPFLNTRGFQIDKKVAEIQVENILRIEKKPKIKANMRKTFHLPRKLDLKSKSVEKKLEKVRRFQVVKYDCKLDERPMEDMPPLGYFRILAQNDISLLRKTLELNGMRADAEHRWHLLWTTKVLKKNFYFQLSKF